MLLSINPEHPEPRKLTQAVDVMRRGGVIAYPTDTVYALGCDITNKHAVEKMRRMKGMRPEQLVSFVCSDLSDAARYGQIEDAAYRIMRRLVPGPYTFILTATREVPKVLRMKRKTVGIRIPNHPVALGLAAELGNPVASSSASIDGDILIDPAEMEQRLHGIDLVIDVDQAGITPSTIIDLSGPVPEVVREGAGPVDFL